MKLRPLERRTFKAKNPSLSFFCALCRTPRYITSSFRLTKTNYLQILLLTAITTLLLYPLIGLRGSVSFFFFLGGFEWVRRANYRKELPCPHCGFDASWYQKDVKVARRLVSDYWADKGLSDLSDESAGEAPPPPLDEIGASVGERFR